MSKHKFLRLILANILLIMLMYTSSANAARFNMSYLYGNYNYSNLVARTGNALNEVSPSYFDLYSSGNLKLNTVDKSFVDEMHSKGIKVTPFLSNHWDREKGRNALSNIDNLTTQIEEAIKKYNLDGINVDIENVTEKDRQNYVLLVKRLREKLGDSKSISVAVAANPYNWQTGWHGSYDYVSLAKYADYLMIMTYDEHYESGSPGPVASIDFVEKSIKYAIERVEPSKIVLGIPFFGRYWQDGVYYGGYGISLERISTLTSKYSTTFIYDDVACSPKAIMKVKSSDPKITVNGRTLNTGTYTIWYENEKSILAKLELVKKYNLKGTGSWSLGQETADTWNYYTAKLNEGYVEENEHESQNNENTSSSWALSSVEYVKEKGWMKGRTDAEFYPKEGLTRAEFATILVRVLNLDKYNALKYTYLDTRGHWAEKSISLVSASGYMRGYGGEEFNPDKFITREEVAKVLSFINFKDSLSVVENVTFTDVSMKRWSYEYIYQIAKFGIMKGYNDRSFRPQDIVKREEMAVILERAF